MAGQQHRVLLLLLTLLLGHTFTSSGTVAAAAEPNTLVVQYAEGNRAQARANLIARQYTILKEVPSINAFVVQPSSAAVSAAAAAGATTAAAQTAAHVDEVQGLSDVVAVVANNITYGINPPSLDAGGNSTQSSPQQQQQTAAAAAAAAGTTCTWPSAVDIDYTINQDTEGTPWGVKMVQADDPEMRAIAKQHKDKVLYCVMDTGLDVTNQDFTGVVLNGSSPVQLATGRRVAWNQDTNETVEGHGTHVSGIISAMHNGKGVLGVSPEGANLFQYRIMPNGVFNDMTDMVTGWEECIAELERRRAKTNTPDMKLVISMSFGGAMSAFGGTDPIAQALSKLATKRPDVMWLAAAGNEYKSGNQENCPACYPDVIAVAAVDATATVADYSNRGAYVDIAAPGSNYLSTIPLAFTASSNFYRQQGKGVLTITPAIQAQADNPDFFISPPPWQVDGSPLTDVSGPLMDCGLGISTCKDASGKICLMERGEVNFCQKVISCQTGGGVGVLLYNKGTEPPCDQMNLITISQGCTAPAGGYATTMALNRVQGLALKEALAAGTSLSVSIKPVKLTVQKEYGLGMLSGTSMATPNAAGVAGLVWSAHTDCTRDQIRAALQATATLHPGSSTASAVTQQGTRSDAYGYGIIQALAAHNYLKAKPCSKSGQGSAEKLNVTVVIRAETGTNKTDSTDGTPQAVGTWVHVVVRVKDSQGNKVAGQMVRLNVSPSKNYLKCGTYERATRAEGAFGVRCRVLKPGKVTVTATVPASTSHKRSTGTSAVTVKA